MAKIGHEITKDELDKIMQEHDLKKDGVISYIEFKALFLDLKDMEDANDYKFTKQWILG